MAKGLIDEFSSAQVEEPSSTSAEFTNNALSRSVDESQAGLFDIMLNNSKVQGSPVAMKKLSPIHNANLFKEFGLLHDSGKRRYYTTWKKDAKGVLLMEKAAKSRNEKYTNYYFVANEGYIDVYEKSTPKSQEIVLLLVLCNPAKRNFVLFPHIVIYPLLVEEVHHTYRN